MQMGYEIFIEINSFQSCEANVTLTLTRIFTLRNVAQRYSHRRVSSTFWKRKMSHEIA